MKRLNGTPVAFGLGMILLAGAIGCAPTSDGGASPEATDSVANGNIDIEKVTTFDEIDPDPDVQKLLPDSVRDGKVTIALSAAAPPTTFVGADGKTSLGLNADITRALVRIMGIEAELVSVPFDSIIPGLASKKYQWSMASMSPTKERLEVLDMVTFTKGGTSIAVPVDNPKELTLDTLCGVRMGVNIGSIMATRQLPDLNEDLCTSQGRDAIVAVEVPSTNEGLLALSSDRIDAYMGDGVPLTYAYRVNEGQFELLEDDSLNAGSARDSALQVSIGAMAVPKNSDFTPALVEAMKVLQAMPQYQAIYERWGMDEFALTADEVEQIKEAK